MARPPTFWPLPQPADKPTSKQLSRVLVLMYLQYICFIALCLYIYTHMNVYNCLVVCIWLFRLSVSILSYPHQCASVILATLLNSQYEYTAGYAPMRQQLTQ